MKILLLWFLEIAARKEGHFSSKIHQNLNNPNQVPKNLISKAKNIKIKKLKKIQKYLYLLVI
jgi:hypothetical protein